MMSGLIATPQSTAHTTRSTFDPSRFLYGDFNHLSNEGFERLCHGDAAAFALRQWRGGPSGLFRGQLEDSFHAGFLRQKLATKLEGILTRGMSHLIHEGLHRKGGMRASDHPPPEHGHTRFGRGEIDGHVRNVIRNGCCPFDGCRVDPVLDHRRHDRVCHDRLTDDHVPPGCQFTVCAEPSL
jgi:hypothetical protein